MNVQQLENELWEAADQLRANSKLTAAEYAMPVLGLISWPSGGTGPTGRRPTKSAAARATALRMVVKRRMGKN